MSLNYSQQQFVLSSGKVILRLFKDIHKSISWSAKKRQLQLTDCSYDLSLAKRRVECCVNDIQCWMVNNGLKFNQDKTEVVLIRSKSRYRPSLEFVQVVDEKI